MTFEPQYQPIVDTANRDGVARLGLMASWMWRTNPSRLLFGMARYKFVSRMLEGKSLVAEVGCSDAWLSRLVKQTVGELHVYDADPIFIADAEARQELPDGNLWPITPRCQNVLDGPLQLMNAKPYDAIYCLDVLEHIPLKDETLFFSNMRRSMSHAGMMIVGVPTVESQQYASEQSRAGHVNMKTSEELLATMNQYFYNTLLFSMNDEVVHTGYRQMAHYLFAIGTDGR